MSLAVAREILNNIQTNSLAEIKDQLNPYSLDQRRFILSTDVGGSSLLYHAVFYRRFSVIIYFLDECGADPNSFGTKDNEKWTCLSQAVSLDSQDMTDILLSRGADINAVSFCNRTPVNIACFIRQLGMVTYLVEKGADISTHDSKGNDILVTSLYNCQIFKYLVQKGADINLVDAEGKTVLMHALMLYRRTLVSFLLSREDIDVRIKNGYEEDALNLAIRFSSDQIVQKIIRRGDYTKEEIIRAYELESCHASINRSGLLSHMFWDKACELRGLPESKRIFDNLLPNSVLDDDIVLFERDYVPALLYLKSLCGPRHVLRIRAMATALSFVADQRDIFVSYKSFFKILHSLSVSDFLQIHPHVQKMFTHFVDFLNDGNLIDGFFEVFRYYTSIFFEKLQQAVTPSMKKLAVVRLGDFVNHFLKMVIIPIMNYERKLDVTIREIVRFISIYSKHLTTMSILQICFKRNNFAIFRTVISCGADVNQTDDNDETILHYLLDSSISSRMVLIQSVVDCGFDFSLVESTRYCLPCRLKKEGFTNLPTECNTLQCLAANTICQKIVFTLTDLPQLLKTIIQMHLHIP